MSFGGGGLRVRKFSHDRPLSRLPNKKGINIHTHIGLNNIYYSGIHSRMESVGISASLRHSHTSFNRHGWTMSWAYRVGSDVVAFVVVCSSAP